VPWAVISCRCSEPSTTRHQLSEIRRLSAPLGVQPVTEVAVHARHREPHLWPVEFQQHLEFRQTQPVFLDELTRTFEDHGVEMNLDFLQHEQRNVGPLRRFEKVQQV
jgi:hypothetical protein